MSRPDRCTDRLQDGLLALTGRLVNWNNMKRSAASTVAIGDLREIRRQNGQFSSL